MLLNAWICAGLFEDFGVVFVLKWLLCFPQNLVDARLRIWKIVFGCDVYEENFPSKIVSSC